MENKTNNRRYILGAVMLVLVCLTAYMAAKTLTNDKAYTTAMKIKTDLQEENEKLKQTVSQTEAQYKSQLNALNKEMEALKQQVKDQETKLQNSAGLKDFEISALKKKGLANPEADISADLEKHPELIPQKAVLGGKMGFSAIHVLSSKWVWAAYEDGHIMGAMLLSYKVSSKGKISLHVIDSDLY